MFEAGIFPRDLSIALLLLGYAGLALMRPWLGVLGLAALTTMHPQGYAPGFMKTFPVYASLFGVTLAGAAIALARRQLSFMAPRLLLQDWRLYGLGGIWLWFAVSSYFSVAPWEAWDKFNQVARILPPLLLALLLLDSRAKLQAMVAVLGLCIMLVAFKGGYWAVMTGFQDRVYGPPGSQFYDNNEFAVAVCMAIPLLVFWLGEVRARAARAFLLIGIVFCYGSVVSSWSRGGLLALAAVTLVLVLQSKRKLLLIPLLLLLAGVLFIQLPEAWFGRMQTLGNVTAEESAASRLAVWQNGLEFALQHPISGGGFNVWPALNLEQGGLDWHSIYVEMLTEHGFVGLILWAGLLFGAAVRMALYAWGGSRHPDAWFPRLNALLLASLLAYLVGGATLGIAYWELPYLIVALSISARALHDPAASPVSRPSKTPAAVPA